MKLTTLTTAIILATIPMTGAFAAALDRSGQSISAFLQPGNYFEAGISVLDPTVSGTANANGSTLADMGDDYYFPSAALKLQLTDNLSFGLIYDQPFAAEGTYSTGDFVHPAAGGVLHNGAEATKAEFKTQNLTMLFGFQPTENFNIYGGPVYQTAKGNVQLRGLANGSTTGFGSVCPGSNPGSPTTIQLIAAKNPLKSQVLVGFFVILSPSCWHYRYRLLLFTNL